jgi:hypothetical protein
MLKFPICYVFVCNRTAVRQIEVLAFSCLDARGVFGGGGGEEICTNLEGIKFRTNGIGLCEIDE